jgi:hypothetical protein
MVQPKINEPLIKKVLGYIRKYPASYDQNEVINSCAVEADETPCGAIGCFGGWAVLLSMKPNERHLYAESTECNDLAKAGDLLGLTSDEQNFLFAGASGDPKKDYALIKKRLTHIRERRAGSKLTHEDIFGKYLNFPGGRDPEDEGY